MHDLKFKEAWFSYAAILKPSELRSECLKETLATFNKNMKRAHRMVTTIPWLFGRAQLLIRAMMVGKFRHERPIVDLFDGPAMGKPEMWKVITKAATDIIKDFNKPDKDFDKRTWDLYESGSGQFLAAIEDSSVGEAAEFAESSLIFMLLNTWSAFEIMATDLWIAAVNFGDEEFAARICTKGKESKSFPYVKLRPHIENLKLRMGTLLVESERVKMDCFTQLSFNYGEAFGRVVEESFELHKVNPANILVLESLRNTLMHRGEKIDAKFEGQVAQATGCSLPQIVALRAGDVFQVDGEIVKTLVQSVLDFSGNLFRIMDKLITPDDVWNSSLKNPANVAQDWDI